MAKSTALAAEASRRASLLLSYIPAVCAFAAPCQPGASTAIIDRLSHSQALSQFDLMSCPVHGVLRHDRVERVLLDRGAPAGRRCVAASLRGSLIAMNWMGLVVRGALVSLVSVGAFACASAYQVPAETVAIRSSLGEEQALAIVGSALKPQPGGTAGAYEAYLPERTLPLNPRVSGSNITFELMGPEVSASSTPEPGCKVPSGDLVAVAGRVQSICTHDLPLKKLRRIRVIATDGDPADASWPGAKVARGYVVFVQEGRASGIYINVKADGLNPLVAALTLLSPHADLVQGAGF